MSGKSRRRRFGEYWAWYLRYVAWRNAFVVETGVEPSGEDFERWRNSDFAERTLAPQLLRAARALMKEGAA